VGLSMLNYLKNCFSRPITVWRKAISASLSSLFSSCHKTTVMHSNSYRLHPPPQTKGRWTGFPLVSLVQILVQL
jgi:hypothetical protein